MKMWEVKHPQSLLNAILKSKHSSNCNLIQESSVGWEGINNSLFS